MIKDRKTLSKTRRKRIRWSRSSSPNVVGYRLYWTVLGDVSYDSEFVDIGDRDEIMLPDQVPPLVHVHGKVALGITALSREGNESDMVRVTIDFDSPDHGVSAGMLRPGAEGWEAPAKASLLVDDLHFWLIRNPDLKGPGQSANKEDYYVESHHVEKTRR
jgi:hypothetical protein